MKPFGLFLEKRKRQAIEEGRSGSCSKIRILD
jgi:hypothetical protein